MADRKRVAEEEAELEVRRLERDADTLAATPTTASTADPSTNRPSVELGPPKRKDG